MSNEKPTLVSLDRRLAIVETKLIDHDETLNDVSTSMKALQATINTWSGALLVITPIVAFFGALLGQKVF